METANQIDLLIEKIKELGYSVKIKNVGDHKFITWSTKNHFAYAPYKEGSEEDLLLLSEILQQTIASATIKQNNNKQLKQKT